MTRRTSGTPIRASRTRRAVTPPPPARDDVAEPPHADRLAEIVDHLTYTKQAADQLGERFLSYLLGMAIQETRTAMRGTPAAARE